MKEYARGSRYAAAEWKAAERELRQDGWSETDADSILSFAFTSALSPLATARAAIKLRAHVRAGCPL